MAHIGALGEKPHEVDETTFDYFGETLHANAGMSELDYVDFLEVAGSIDVNDPAGLRMVKDYARICVAESEFEKFWALAKANRQSVEEVFNVLMRITEAVLDRPTGLPSGSADTHGSDGTTSAGDDYSRALRVVENRPDLQLAVVAAREARSA